MPDIEESLTAIEERKLRAAGFVPTSWWHPAKHIIVEDEYLTAPRFTILSLPGRDEPDARFTADEIVTVALNTPDAPVE